MTFVDRLVVFRYYCGYDVVGGLFVAREAGFCRNTTVFSGTDPDSCSQPYSDFIEGEIKFHVWMEGRAL